MPVFVMLDISELEVLHVPFAPSTRSNPHLVMLHRARRVLRLLPHKEQLVQTAQQRVFATPGILVPARLHVPFVQLIPTKYQLEMLDRALHVLQIVLRMAPLDLLAPIVVSAKLDSLALVRHLARPVPRVRSKIRLAVLHVPRVPQVASNLPLVKHRVNNAPTARINLAAAKRRARLVVLVRHRMALAQTHVTALQTRTATH